jgi:predicted SnoaL-like aldol condensation-catalyzing enzyme
MKIIVLSTLYMVLSVMQSLGQDVQLDFNKKVARDFYENLWFTNNTSLYNQFVADSYFIHDIGDDRNGVEEAVVQKEIADFFWENGSMTGKIEYQIAEDDLVATRWIWSYKPSTLLGKFLIGTIDIPIINVFRIRNGKIVEIWNHRYDIDTNRTNIYVAKGVLFGLLIALFPLTWALILRKKLKKLKSSIS